MHHHLISTPAGDMPWIAVLPSDNDIAVQIRHSPRLEGDIDSEHSPGIAKSRHPRPVNLPESPAFIHHPNRKGWMHVRDDIVHRHLH